MCPSVRAITGERKVVGHERRGQGAASAACLYEDAYKQNAEGSSASAGDQRENQIGRGHQLAGGTIDGYRRPRRPRRITMTVWKDGGCRERAKQNARRYGKYREKRGK